MKKIVTLLLLLLSCHWAESQIKNLPNNLTKEELPLYKDLIYNRPVIQSDDPNPPPGPVRTMAEWEECRGVVITWTSFESILSQIVNAAQRECLVYIICSDSNSVKTFLINNNVPTINCRYLVTGFNTIWCRDYGPWAVYSGVADTMRLIDWIYNRPRPLDDVTPVFIANYLGVPVHQTINPPNDLVATGGNFMVDGHGTAFSSRLILIENPGKTETQVNSIENSYMGITRYIKMETLPYDVIHHIDMHIKLLDEETLLVGQYPPGIADGPQIELNLQYILNNFQTCYGRPYKVIRIPMPPQNGQYPPNGDYRTYTNSLIINKTVIIPSYELQYDTTAFRIYREAMPGYTIVSIDCNAIIPSLGAIHCITKEIGVREPIFISHAGQLNTSITNQPYEVKAYIKTSSGVANAKVYWSTDTSAGFNQLNMTSAADTFRAFIPAQIVGTKIYYYISANSNSGRTVTKPLTAPSGNYRFSIINSIGIIQLNNSIPVKYSLYQNYPNPFNPSTSIRFDIPKNGMVSLKIYDILGKEIYSVSEFRSAGHYEVRFDASNYSSGLYFYMIESGSFIQTKKMILIK